MELVKIVGILIGAHDDNNVNALSVVNYAISLRAYPPFRGSEFIFVPERNAFGLVGALSTALGSNRTRLCNYLMYADNVRVGFLTSNATKGYGVNALQKAFKEKTLRLYAPFRARLIDEWRNTLRELNLHVMSHDPEKPKRASKYHASMGKDDRVMTLLIGALVMGTFMGAARDTCIRTTNGTQTLCNCGRGTGHS